MGTGAVYTDEERHMSMDHARVPVLEAPRSFTGEETSSSGRLDIGRARASIPESWR
jgi:hypothetical protein